MSRSGDKVSEMLMRMQLSRLLCCIHEYAFMNIQFDNFHNHHIFSRGTHTSCNSKWSSFEEGLIIDEENSIFFGFAMIIIDLFKK